MLSGFLNFQEWNSKCFFSKFKTKGMKLERKSVNNQNQTNELK